MAGCLDDRALHGGVPIQVHAYISPTPPTNHSQISTKRQSPPDPSTLRVRDGKHVEIVTNGASEETGLLSLDHVYHQPQGTEHDVMERSLQPLIKASVEGVNTALLAVGSLRSKKSDLLFNKMTQQSLAAAMFQSLVALLESKAATMRNTQNNSSLPRYSFSMRMSFVEIYEEQITDLLANSSAGGSSSQAAIISITDGTTSFKKLQDAAISAQLRSSEMARQLVLSGFQNRHRENGLYGNATEFSSAILRFHIQQTFEFQDSPPQQLFSTLDIVDFPPSDRLANSGGMIRLSEGPLLNKSLYTLSDCLSCLTDNPNQGSRRQQQPPYDESQLTQLLQDSLSGNCLTFALLFLAPGDANGSKTSVQLVKRLQSLQTFPVANNDVIRGLHTRYFAHITYIKQANAPFSSLPNGADDGGRGYVARIHELDGRLAQEQLEKKLLKEDKDKIVSVLHELKAKYQELFDNEIEIRKELLSCEQEKLTLSQAFVSFQMEKNAQLQDFENEKFECETKLIHAEEMVLQIQQDDQKKASQIQDLCHKMNELIQEKRVLGEQVALLQKHCSELDQTTAHETKKNQQLSLELLVLVNQKQKNVLLIENLEIKNRELVLQVQSTQNKDQDTKTEIDHHKARTVNFENQIETLRKDLARKEVEMEKMELQTRRTELEFEKQAEGLVRDKESGTEKALAQATVQVTVLQNDQKLLQQQLDHCLKELEKCEKEKTHWREACLAKSQEIEELVVTRERLLHENQSQMDEFRLKLTFLMPGSSSFSIGGGNRHHDSATNGTMELLQSYQRKERELRGQLVMSQRALDRHKMKTYPSTATAAESASPQESEIRTKETETEIEMMLTQELNELRERLHTAELRELSQMDQLAEAASQIKDLQQQLQELRTQNQNLQHASSSSGGVPVAIAADENRAVLEATRQMQTLIVRQLEHVRQLASCNTTQEPSASSADEPRMRPPTATSSAQTEWLKQLEHVERRCADLLTKNVMLNEENAQLRTTLKSLITRLHTRQR